MHKKKLIGITGGVGAGKSSVLNILRTDYHARIILADEVAHMLMEPGSEGLSQVWGQAFSWRTEVWIKRLWQSSCSMTKRCWTR